MSSRGFSLPELLIASALGASLLAAALTGYLSARQRQQEVEQLARLQEQAAHVFSVLEPELQMAGFGGLRSLAGIPGTALPATARACGSTPAELGSGALRILDGVAWPLACPARGGGAVAGADLLVLTRASGRSATPEAGRVQVLSDSGRPGMRLVLDGRVPPGITLAEGRAELRDLVHTVFYVARRADGTSRERPALRFIELTSIDGAPALRDTEILDGVEDLQVEEGWRASSAPEEPLRFSPPGVRPATRPLLAVRVHVLLRGGQRLGRARPQGFAYAGRTLRFHDAWPRLLAERSFVPRDLPLAAGG